MRTVLEHDSAAGVLRLVMTDYYNGQHERTAYLVVNDDGSPVRRGQEFDGLTAYREQGSTYRTRRNSVMPWLTFQVESTPRPTERTPCPRATNRRRKCAICSEENAR